LPPKGVQDDSGDPGDSCFFCFEPRILCFFNPGPGDGGGAPSPENQYRETNIGTDLNKSDLQGTEAEEVRTVRIATRKGTRWEVLNL
jgi:hypothetical protein